MTEGNPFALVAAAARGDVEAQRALAHAALLRFYRADGTPIAAEHISIVDWAALIEGLAFARMAASQGEASDNNRLIAMLSLGCHLPPECACPIEAETIARASMWNERSSLTGEDAEGADLLVNQFTEQASPEAVALAPAYRTLIQESEAV